MATKKAVKKSALKKEPGHRKRTMQDIAEFLKDFNTGKHFEIDKNPPPPTIHRVPEEIEKFREKLARSVAATPIGEAFIIPTMGRGVAQVWLKRNFSDYTFRYSEIADNKVMTRVYKLPAIKRRRGAYKKSK